MDTNYITPVEKIGKYYFKREDLYIPFNFSTVNGSKLRQCQLLVEKNTKFKGLVTGTSIKSPQAPIISAVGKSLSIPVKIMYGGTTKQRLEQNKYSIMCKEYGADVDIVSKMGYTSVLNKKAQDFANENNFFNIRYGFDLYNNLDVFIDSTANQVKNINNIDNIVVTVGSAITLIGILYGIAKYNINVKKVFAIGCAPNRMKKINEYSNVLYIETGLILPLEKVTYIDAFNEFKGFKYENTMNEEYYGIKFHPRYESKTFNWLKNSNIEEKTLMWITGSDL